MDANRKQLYTDLENKLNTKLLVYATSHRPGMETNIAGDILPFFTEHLDIIDKAEKISLLLITNGGDTLTAWSLVNLIRSYCDNFEVIVPANCFSSGTLICLGADDIIMTKQATLGPIDPSTNGPLNPVVPGTNLRVPVSVEIVNAYIEMAKNTFSIQDDKCMTQILLKLSDMIHPLTLGQVYRSRQQIQMLAGKLMSLHNVESEKQEKIIKFLCSESGSHDYAIRRKEASENLELNIKIPDTDLYKITKYIYNNICTELEFSNPYRPEIILGANNNANYTCRRCIIESIAGGTDVMLSEGVITKAPNGANLQILDHRTFEGWRHE